MAFWMLAFFLVPLILIILYSFGTQGVYQNGVSLGFKLDWYRQILSDPSSRKAFMLTMQMVLFNTGGCLLLGYPLAYFISVKSGKRKTLFVLLIMLPFWTSFLIRTYAWITILDNNGLLNGWMKSLGLIDEPIRILYTNYAVYLVLIYDYLPFMVLPLFVGIEKIHKSLYEASKDLGAGKWTTSETCHDPVEHAGHLRRLHAGRDPDDGRVRGARDHRRRQGRGLGLADLPGVHAGRNWPLGAALSNVLLVFMLIVVAPVRAGRGTRRTSDG